MAKKCNGENGPACPFLTYCDVKNARHEATKADFQARLLADLEFRNSDPDLVAMGIDSVNETTRGEFAAFGNMMARLGDAVDQNDAIIAARQQNRFRWLRTQCMPGPIERRRFWMFGQKVVRCSSLLKFGIPIHEEAYLKEIQALDTPPNDQH